MEETGRRRRTALKALVALGVGGPLLWRYLTPRVDRREALLEVPKAELPPGAALVYRESRVALVRRGDEVLALSLVCTHLGCTLNPTPTAFECPCHGSLFGLGGEVLTGPADRPLARLSLEDRGDRWAVLG
ncbi:MAG: QcrA and Rieske domain-containing protein [Deferrisomatales bacterium]